MSPFELELLGVAFRWALTSLGAYLVAHHVLSPDQEATFSGHAVTYLMEHIAVWAPMVSGLMLGIYAKYRSRIKFLTALESTSEEQVKAKMSKGMGATL